MDHTSFCVALSLNPFNSKQYIIFLDVPGAFVVLHLRDVYVLVFSIFDVESPQTQHNILVVKTEEESHLVSHELITTVFLQEPLELLNKCYVWKTFLLKLLNYVLPSYFLIMDLKVMVLKFQFNYNQDLF